MFWFLVDVLALRRLGLSRPLRYFFLVILAGCVVVGLIYATVVIHAINERSHPAHVHANSNR